MELRGRLLKRLQALRKVSNTTWGLGNHILAVTTHALLESIICYGMASTGARAGIEELRSLDTLFINRAARRVVGTNIVGRRRREMGGDCKAGTVPDHSPPGEIGLSRPKSRRSPTR